MTRKLKIQKSKLRPGWLIVLGDYPPSFASRLAVLVPSLDREFDRVGQLWRVHVRQKDAIAFLVHSVNSQPNRQAMEASA